jgi:uncharacterized protein (TIGR01777 family)
MNILLTGGTGLIGRALCASLIAKGHSLTVFSRRPETVKHKCGPTVEGFGSLDAYLPEHHYDAVINLAGEPIVGPRWTKKRKKILWDSRVKLTTTLVKKMAQAKTGPAVFISGSAVGIYGDCGASHVDETHPVADDFGARLCYAWEQAALKAEALNVRTCLIRTGLVLSRDGGMLKKLLLPFRLGLGSRIGNGKQWMSWIHIEDQVAIIERLLSETDCRGAFNVCSPRPVNNSTFTQCLAKTLHRPAFLSTPALIIGPLLGESATLLLGGQKVFPAKMELAAYHFEYPELEMALEQIITQGSSDRA